MASDDANGCQWPDKMQPMPLYDEVSTNSDNLSVLVMMVKVISTFCILTEY